MINGQWYEFDDQYVTEVHETVVQNAEGYVLFYRWAPGRAWWTNLTIPVPWDPWAFWVCVGDSAWIKPGK